MAKKEGKKEGKGDDRLRELGPLDFFHDPESKTVIVGITGDEEEFKRFVEYHYPGCEIEFATPEFIKKAREKKKVVAKKAKRDTEIKAKIAELDKRLVQLKLSGQTAEAYRLLKRKEALEAQLA